MTIPPEHRIGRVEFQISAPDSAAARQISAFLRARFDSIISPALDDALTRVGTPGEVVRIGRVEIDLGHLDQKTLTGQGLRRQIEAALAAALGGAPAPAAPGSVLDAQYPAAVAADEERFLMLHEPEGENDGHEHLQLVHHWFQELERTFSGSGR